MQNKRGAILPDKGVRAFQVEPDVCGSVAPFFYATLFVSVCVCFERDAVVPSAVGRREGCCRIHYRCLWRENGTSIRAASFLTKIFTCRWLDVPPSEPELKYGAGAARLEKAAGTVHPNIAPVPFKSQLWRAVVRLQLYRTVIQEHERRAMPLVNGSY